jgi:hypothetical protein
MTRRSFDPLALIPPANVIREKLRETELLAARLRILLDLAERLDRPAGGSRPTDARGAGHAGDGTRA